MTFFTYTTVPLGATLFSSLLGGLYGSMAFFPTMITNELKVVTPLFKEA
jgi:hypothetical protein